MDVFADYLSRIAHPGHQERTAQVLAWVSRQFPQLVPKIAWHQPMFTDHGTFIIAFSVAKKHLAVAPERAAIDHFADDIKRTGYAHTKELVRIGWDSPLDFDLLARMIEFNIADKADHSLFWRK